MTLVLERELVPGSLLLRPMAGTGPSVSLEEATMLNPETNLVYGKLNDYGFGDRRVVYTS